MINKRGEYVLSNGAVVFVAKVVTYYAVAQDSDTHSKILFYMAGDSVMKQATIPNEDVDGLCGYFNARTVSNVSAQPPYSRSASDDSDRFTNHHQYEPKLPYKDE